MVQQTTWANENGPFDLLASEEPWYLNNYEDDNDDDDDDDDDDDNDNNNYNGNNNVHVLIKIIK